NKTAAERDTPGDRARPDRGAPGEADPQGPEGPGRAEGPFARRPPGGNRPARIRREGAFFARDTRAGRGVEAHLRARPPGRRQPSPDRKSRAEVNDRDFLAAFEAGTLPEEQFHHPDHVRAAWLLLREEAPAAALA